MKVLILCTGNSCRSQMAEAYLKSIDENLQVFSAGTRPEKEVNPFAIKVMNEIGISLESQYPKNVNIFLEDFFNLVVTVCDNAKESCPVFNGLVENTLHYAFEDPANAEGSEEEVLEVYRKVRNQIVEQFDLIYNNIIMTYFE